MKIGIDVSQLAYPNTGVANYLGNLVRELIENDRKNEYILFYSSLRRNFQFTIYNFQSNSNVTMKQFKFPPLLLDILWNKLHIAPIEWFVGDVDIFITSDWTEPPAKKAKKATILYDLLVYSRSAENLRIHAEDESRKNETQVTFRAGVSSIPSLCSVKNRIFSSLAPVNLVNSSFKAGEVHKYPEEMHKKIIQVQKKKLAWVKKESSIVFCISESTKKDASEILGIDMNKLKVLYPGL